MKTLAIFLISFLLGNEVEASVEGSQDEAKKIQYLLHVKWQDIMDRQQFDQFTQVYDPQVTMIVNGHKPIKGVKGMFFPFRFIKEVWTI